MSIKSWQEAWGVEGEKWWKEESVLHKYPGIQVDKAATILNIIGSHAGGKGEKLWGSQTRNYSF